MKHLLLPITFLFLLLSSLLYSQQKWRQLTAADGLSSNVVNQIYQTKNGDIWIGTKRGVDRYNGVFQPFFYQTDSGVELSSDIFETITGQPIIKLIINKTNHPRSVTTEVSLFEDLEWNQPAFLVDNDITVSYMPEFAVESGGKLWISTLGGLVALDGQKWQIYDPDVRIDWLVKTPDGRLWTESWDLDGIASFDGRKWNLEFNTDNSLLENATTNTVFAASNGMILLGTDEGLFQYDSVLNSITDLKLGQVNVNSMLEAHDGSIWVCAEDQNQLKKLSRLHDGQWTTHLPDQAITTIYQSPTNDLWAGGDDGLYLFDGKIWRRELTDKVNCLYQLTDGTMLVGSNSGLWVRLSIDSFKLEVHQRELWVKGLFQASNGVIWCRSNQGIFSYDGQSWTKHWPSTIPSWGHIGLRSSVHEAPDGTIWFNTDGGVGSFKDGIWKEQYLPSSAQHNLFVELTTTNDGRIWAVGASGAWWSAGNDKWVHAIQTNQWIGGFIESPTGRYWIGPWELSSHSSPVTTAYSDGDRWIEIPIDQGGQITFFEDDEGTLFAAGNGIYKWQESNQTWLKLTGDEAKDTQFRAAKKALDGTWRVMSNGTPDLGGSAANVFAAFDGEKLSVHPSSEQGDLHYRNGHGDGFTEWPAGVFWLATSNGLRRIQGDTWYDLTVTDGLPSNSVWSVITDNQGYLWVGTEEGVVRYKPPINLDHPPAVKIKRVDGEEVPEDKVYLTGRSYVTIDWDGGDLQSSNDRLLYQYSIDGQWAELRQNTATFGLENGEHQFVIRAVDHHFNTSAVDSMTIIVKTELPVPNFSSPSNGDIVRGQVYIKGDIVDNDFANYQIFVTDANLEQRPNTEMYKPLFEASVLPRTATLAVWKTQSSKDTDYKIWLVAQDELEHTGAYSIKVRVDNTLPTVELELPIDNQRVLKQVVILARIADIHLDIYRLEFSIDSEGKSWEQIHLQAGLYQETEDELLRKPELQTIKIDKDWEIPILEGSVWIRLTATDIAGNTNSQTIQVEVPTAVVTRKGGTIAPDDQQAELYFPPNTLAQDTIVTVNVVPGIEVEPPVRRVSQIYDFSPTTLRLNAIKPATLTISYDASQLSAGQEPVIFHRTDGPWKAIGGTPNPQQQTISAAVLSLGQYTLGEMDKIQAQDSATLKPDSLTCQPRVFSPKGNAFSTHTTISFTLDQPAQVTIKVYNVAGQLVEWLAQQQTFGSGKQAIRWDGRDSQGEIVSTGLYIVTVTVGDQRQDKVVNVWNH